MSAAYNPIKNQEAFDALPEKMQQGVTREINRMRDVAPGLEQWDADLEARTGRPRGEYDNGQLIVDEQGHVFLQRVDRKAVIAGREQVLMDYAQMRKDGKIVREKVSNAGGTKRFTYRRRTPWGRVTVLADLNEVYNRAIGKE